MPKLVVLIAIVAALLSFHASIPTQDPVVRESDHDLEEGAAVSIDSVIGTLRVRTGDQPKAHLRTVQRGRDAGLVTFHVDSSPKKLQVEARFPRKPTEVSIEIDLVLPRTALASMSVSTVSGSIDLKDLRSDQVVLKATSGRIGVHGLRGDLVLKSISGDVDVEGVAGSTADITLTSGSLHGSGELKSLNVESISGNVTFDLTPPKEGGWSIRASLLSGGVSLRLPDGSGGSLDLSSLSGKVSSGLALRDRQEGGRSVNQSLRGSFGKGSGVVRLTTVSGNIRVDPLD